MTARGGQGSEGEVPGQVGSLRACATATSVV